jgi:uncharacterized protein YndB with AHSA1/START domain
VVKIALWVVVGLVGVVILVVVIGWLLPREHVVTRVGRYRQRPEAVWEAITNVDAMPSWREGLKSVQKLPDVNGLPAHVEVMGSMTIPMQTMEMVAPKRLVERIADDKLPFGGTWTYEIAPTAEGSTLRITENGFVGNPIFRFMSKFVMGQASTMETYLRSLAKKFGEEPRIGE